MNLTVASSASPGEGRDARRADGRAVLAGTRADRAPDRHDVRRRSIAPEQASGQMVRRQQEPAVKMERTRTDN
jgi:hypothetical protein